ncbi:MAG TPA: PQQ-dependent sugar dehydrogenase, partial [Myxococcota bacterium]|nr:PQQ-dependent sugar dehydrogenase [Myxococcota bacterium]
MLRSLLKMLRLAVLLATVPVAASHAVPVVRIASMLTQPIYVASPPGDERLFVVERGGTVRILQGEQVLPTAFLDISDRVDQQGEGGLMSIAFAPDYASSRAFYLFYTTTGNPLTTRISRFRAN